MIVVRRDDSVQFDNRISLQKLEVFCLVVDLGSVSRAAERLYVTQPVVSAHLRSLQERIGATLFVREGRGLELTEAGIAVHSWAQELLGRRDDLSQELDDLAQGHAGSVVVGASMSVGNYLLPSLLIEFHKQNPGALITLTVSAPELAVEAVRAGQQHFCVVASDSTFDTAALTAELIGKQRFVLIAAPSDTTVGDSVTVEELRDLTWVAPPGGLAIRRSQDNALAQIGVTRRNVAIELGSAEGMKQAVLAGVGVAMLWEASVGEDIREGKLREVHIEGQEMLDTLYLVRNNTKRLSPLQTRLYERVRGMLAHRQSDAPAQE